MACPKNNVNEESSRGSSTNKPPNHKTTLPTLCGTYKKISTTNYPVN